MKNSDCSILYVDDEPGNLSNFTMTFAAEFNIFTAVDGMTALEVLSAHPEIGVVVADQRMPRMSGVELLERIFALRPHTVRLVLTAYIALDEIVDSINKGHVYQYFFKPWDAGELGLSLRRAVEYYRLGRENRRLACELEEKNRELARENRELAAASARVRELSRELLRAQEEERRKISVYLHDNVAQDLLSLKISCETLGAASDGTGKEARTINALLVRAISSVRELACDLRPLDLDRLGLAGAARAEVRDFSRRHGIDARFDAVGMEGMEIAAEIQVNLYRIMQEALRNVARHAGAAAVSVRLIGSYPDVILRIEDNGRGFISEAAGEDGGGRCLGMGGMAERARLCGGGITVNSSPGRGTMIKVVVPAAGERTHG